MYFYCYLVICLSSRQRVKILGDNHGMLYCTFINTPRVISIRYYFASHTSYNIFLYMKGLVNREAEFENVQVKE